MLKWELRNRFVVVQDVQDFAINEICRFWIIAASASDSDSASASAGADNLLLPATDRHALANCMKPMLMLIGSLSEASDDNPSTTHNLLGT